MFYKSVFIGLDCVGSDIKGIVGDCGLIALASPDPFAVRRSCTPRVFPVSISGLSPDPKMPNWQEDRDWISHDLS